MPPPDGRKVIAQAMVIYHIIALDTYLIAYISPIYVPDASITITLSAFFNTTALAVLSLETRSIGARIAVIIALAVFFITLPISLNLLISAVIFTTQHPLVAITYLGLTTVAWFAYERRLPPPTIVND